MKFDVAFALENAAWPALLVDQASTICRVNPAAIKLFGATLEGESPLLSAIWGPDNGGTAEQFLAHWERAPASTLPLKFRGKGGHDLSFQSSICAFAKDGQKYFVLQLFPEANGHETKSQNGDSTVKQKLDCALQLARTVALDMNNALTGVLGHTSLVLSQLDPDHPSRQSLLQSEACANRAAAIANDLAAFSRHEKVDREHASHLNGIVQRSVEWAQRKHGQEAVQWTLQLEPGLYAIKADESRIQQAFNNILQNAIEALAGNGNGSVILTTRNLELTERTQDRNVQLAAGTYVCVECSDNGCGIEPAVLPRVFEPFFTTKQNPAHRGLGLAMVYGIITNHKGGIAVSSQPGNGTSVRVYLPVDNKVIKSKAPTTNNLRGEQTILIVDDEELMLTVEQTILSAYGYQVRQANSGAKALELLEQPDTGVDLVITDLAMPGMNGVELMEHVRRLSPQTRLLCTSGYVWPGQHDEVAFLQKPFASQDLLAKVKEVLSAEAPVGVGQG